MAYENIKFTKSNMAVYDGYFYMLDSTNNLLLQKLDDGDTAFCYPTDSFIGTVKCLQVFKSYFYSLHDLAGSAGISIKKWKLSDDKCTLKLLSTFNLTHDTHNNMHFEASTFALEHYETSFLYTAIGGSNVIYLSSYANSYFIYPGTILWLINYNNEVEEIIVDSINNETGAITLTSNLLYNYSIGDSVSFCNNFLIPNNYYGSSNTKGMLIRIDTSTGYYVSSEVASGYKNWSCSSFGRFQNVFLEDSDIMGLVLTKSTSNNATICNIDDLIYIDDATTVNDYFSGTDGDNPSSLLWNI